MDETLRLEAFVLLVHRPEQVVDPHVLPLLRGCLHMDGLALEIYLKGLVGEGQFLGIVSSKLSLIIRLDQVRDIVSFGEG